MIEYNSGWSQNSNDLSRLSPSQEEIFKMPEYFALSKEEICSDKGCPDFLKKILEQYPWDGRKSVVQVRPQDFREKKPDLLGDHWHTDIMVRLNDGKVRVAKSSSEFHLMVCSWGGVVGTEFLKTKFKARDIFDGFIPEFSPMDLLNLANSKEQEVFCSKDGELIEYTSRDIHRMGRNYKIGGLRLMIVAFDCDSVEGGGIILPSIEQRELGIGPKFGDYVR